MITIPINTKRNYKRQEKNQNLGQKNAWLRNVPQKVKEKDKITEKRMKT